MGMGRRRRRRRRGLRWLCDVGEDGERIEGEVGMRVYVSGIFCFDFDESKYCWWVGLWYKWILLIYFLGGKVERLKGFSLL